ncbi:RRP15-like protein [Brassica rapa]|uniref:RRP15-like protein n=1 Tax=Brassica campestris TaxID=3711 RepID=M4F527_BRACM|nr:RRP15-like protein [Brassica rapa]XP_013660773.2 RRP15-like protein [Brassica napus]
MSTGDATHTSVAERGTRKRRVGLKNGGKSKNKKQKTRPPSSDRFKLTQKKQKLFQKRARDYNSDDEEEDESKKAPEVTIREKIFSDANMGPNYDEVEEEEDGSDKDENSDGEDHGEIQSGITRFAADDGCNAFKMAFKSIMKSKGDDALGPVLSAQKNLIAQKLAEEEAEKKAKGQARKAKYLVAEKGHVKPANHLESHEKVLIGVATKGVVKLFNAVNKAQHAQKGLNASRSKDAKVLKKRRKEAFFSELGKTPRSDSKAQKSSNANEEEAPAWAPLRDNYMLANPKLKDWDKKQETNEGDDFAAMSGDESYED